MLPLFEGLTPRMEGRLQGNAGRGAIVLRRFRAGEVICRQGEPGWTAFYLIKNEDLIGLRELHRAWAEEAEQKLASLAPALLALPVAERRRRAEALEQAGQLELSELLSLSADGPLPGELEALHAEREILARGDAADAVLQANHPSLATLPLDDKLRHAASIEASDPDLNALLSASAQAAERRVRMAVTGLRNDVASVKKTGPIDVLRTLKTGFRALFPGASPQAASTSAAAAAEADYPIDTLYEGELFGELSCLHHAPRIATVRALRDCYAIEVLGHVLRLLLDSKPFREQVNQTYRKRGLLQLLRTVPLFSRAPDKALEWFRERVQFESVEPGAMIFREGDAPESLHVIRSGTVKLSQDSSGGRVLGYRSRGETIGLEGWLANRPRDVTCNAYQHPRRPAGPQRRLPPEMRLEFVRIERRDFDEACALFPTLSDEARRILAAESAQSTIPKNIPKGIAKGISESGPEGMSAGLSSGVPADDAGASRVHDLGLMQGRKLMLIEVDRCTRCNECVSACAEVHDDGLPRLTLKGPRVDGLMVPGSCRSCSDPVCLVGCPVGSIHQGKAGEIVVKSWCIGCGLCAEQCPYGAIELRALASGASGRDEGREMAVVCDQCAGVAGGPRCVTACSHDAAIRVDAKSFFAGETGGAARRSH